MGDYALQSDVDARVGTVQLARLTADSGSTPDATKVAAAIVDAETEVNASLAKRIATPVNLTLYPDLADWLKGLTVPLAIERVYALRGIYPGTVKSDAANVRAELKAYVAGDRAAPGATTPASTESNGPPDTWGFQPLKSGRSNMEGL